MEKRWTYGSHGIRCRVLVADTGNPDRVLSKYLIEVQLYRGDAPVDESSSTMSDATVLIFEELIYLAKSARSNVPIASGSRGDRGLGIGGPFRGIRAEGRDALVVLRH